MPRLSHCRDHSSSGVAMRLTLMPRGRRASMAARTKTGASKPGRRAPIVTPSVFAAVQEKLTANRSGPRARRAASGAPLVGRLFDDRGNRMTPRTAKRASIRYRYYVSSVLAQGRQSEAGSVARASANKVEALVLEAPRPLELGLVEAIPISSPPSLNPLQA